MTTIALYGGPLKRDIINAAYAATGQGEYEVTPEETSKALRLLSAMLARWTTQLGVDLGYNFPSAASAGSADEESGIPLDAVEAVTQSLARLLAPEIGKALSAEAKANFSEAMASLRATYGKPPMMQMGRNTIRGAGNRRAITGSPFFFTRASDAEIIQ